MNPRGAFFGKRHKLFKVRSDEGGRLTKEFEANVNVVYEMVIASGEYFQAFDLPRAGGQILDEIVVRFRTPDPNACYHIPVIMAPNSYSCWWST